MTRHRLLVDTGPLYALADRNDQYHQQANRELILIKQSRYQIILLYPTLMEAYTLVLRYLGLRFAHQWLTAMQQQCGLLNPTLGDYAAAGQLVKRFGDQVITLFDATLAVVSDQLKTPVWTFDSDFDVMGTEVWRA